MSFLACQTLPLCPYAQSPVGPHGACPPWPRASILGTLSEMVFLGLPSAPDTGAGGAGPERPGHRGHCCRALLQVLVLLLLSIPQALSSEAELDVPLSSPVFSLLFYLTSLALLGLHVMVCTSAGRSCYFCSLPWPAAGAVMLLVSALLCVVASALAKTFLDGKLLRKVRLVPPDATSLLISCLWGQGDDGEGHTVGASAQGLRDPAQGPCDAFRACPYLRKSHAAHNTSFSPREQRFPEAMRCSRAWLVPGACL